MVSIFRWCRRFTLVPGSHVKSCQVLGHLFQLLLFPFLLQVKQLHLSFKPSALFPQLLVLPALLLELWKVSGLQVECVWAGANGRSEVAYELNFVEGLIEASQ